MIGPFSYIIRIRLIEYYILEYLNMSRSLEIIEFGYDLRHRVLLKNQEILLQIYISPTRNMIGPCLYTIRIRLNAYYILEYLNMVRSYKMTNLWDELWHSMFKKIMIFHVFWKALTQWVSNRFLCSFFSGLLIPIWGIWILTFWPKIRMFYSWNLHNKMIKNPCIFTLSWRSFLQGSPKFRKLKNIFIKLSMENGMRNCGWTSYLVVRMWVKNYPRMINNGY